MRLLFLAAFILSSFPLLSQVEIDEKIAEEYEKVKSDFPKSILPYIDAVEEDLNKRYSIFGGVVIFTIDEIDTLNLSELIFSGYSNFEIDSVEVYRAEADSLSQSVEYGGTALEEEMEGGDFKLCTAFAYGDTLSINIRQGVDNQYIGHLIIGDKPYSFFEEYYQYDKVVKLNERDSLTNLLNIPLESSSVILSQSDFKKGDIVFGVGEMSTVPYFIRGSGMNSRLLKIQRRFKYFFKVKIQ